MRSLNLILTRGQAQVTNPNTNPNTNPKPKPKPNPNPNQGYRAWANASWASKADDGLRLVVLGP